MCSIFLFRVWLDLMINSFCCKGQDFMFFNGWILFSCAYASHFLCAPSTDRELRSVGSLTVTHVLTLGSCIAINSQCKCAWNAGFTLIGYIQRSYTAGSYSASVFVFRRNIHAVLHIAWCVLTNKALGPFSSCILHHLFVCLFDSNWSEITVIHLINVSLICNDNELLKVCIAHWYPVRGWYQPCDITD